MQKLQNSNVNHNAIKFDKNKSLEISDFTMQQWEVQNTMCDKTVYAMSNVKYHSSMPIKLTADEKLSRYFHGMEHIYI